MAILRRWNLRSLSSVVGDEIVGWSHGWLAVFNKRRNHLFLSDPFSEPERRINLPAVDTLPDPHFNLDLDGHGSVSKVILSSAPDEDEDEECRAMMTFGPGNRLAFCSPARSSTWTPLGRLYYDHGRKHKHPLESYAKVHEDIVYCTRRKLFISIVSAHLHLHYFDFTQLDGVSPLQRFDWDIRNLNSPVNVELECLYPEQDKTSPNWWNQDQHNKVLANECVQIQHLVYAEESDQLYMAVQFVRLMRNLHQPLGYVPTCELKGLSGVFSGKTYGFIVFKLHDEDVCTPLVEDLQGMTMFVGINHSFAVKPSYSDQFKPNCIYFTDAKRLRMVCCAQDAGVFDYVAKIVSPLHHLPPPLCFT